MTLLRCQRTVQILHKETAESFGNVILQYHHRKLAPRVLASFVFCDPRHIVRTINPTRHICRQTGNSTAYDSPNFLDPTINGQCLGFIRTLNGQYPMRKLCVIPTLLFESDGSVADDGVRIIAETLVDETLTRWQLILLVFDCTL